MAKITVIGAGNVGASLGQRLIEKDLGDVVLLDIIEGLPQGKALDIMQSGAVIGFKHRITGTNDYADTAGSDIVVITSGITRKPGMSREDLIKTNSAIVKDVVGSVVRHSPDCIIIVVTNPVDAMTWVAYKTSGFTRNKVLGLSGVLDGARMSTLIAQECNVPVTDVTCYVLGEHGNNMIIFPKLAMIKGKSITQILPEETIERIIQRTVNGGAEIVGLLKNSSAFYAPSASAAHMVETILANKKDMLVCATVLDGEYHVRDTVMGVPVLLTRNGIHQVLELRLSLNKEEMKILEDCALGIKKQIEALGL